MKYHRIKNLMIASVTAIMYWGWVVDSTTMFQKVLATIAMFMLMFILLCDVDMHLARKRRQKREAKESCEEKTLSA